MKQLGYFLVVKSVVNPSQERFVKTANEKHLGFNHKLFSYARKRKIYVK